MGTATGVGATPTPAALTGLVGTEETEISAGFVVVGGTGAAEGGFDGADVVTGVVAAPLVSSSQSMTSSVTTGAASVAFVVVFGLDVGGTEAAVEVDEARLASSSCRRATRSAFLPV